MRNERDKLRKGDERKVRKVKKSKNPEVFAFVRTHDRKKISMEVCCNRAA